MTWSKGHFAEVARIVAGERELRERTEDEDRVKGGVRLATASMAREFARVFAQQNPRFDSARFLAACGVAV